MRTTNVHVSRGNKTSNEVSVVSTEAEADREAAFPNTEALATIAVIERRAFFRDCIVKSLDAYAHLEVVAAASVDDWLQSQAQRDTALVVLSAEGSSNESTKDNLEKLAAVAPELPVVVLSDSDTVERVVDAIGKGARGYISTETSLDVAIEAMKIVKAGGTFVPASSLLAAYQRNAAPAEPRLEFNSMFTSRQAAVVEALRLGKANKTIAYELNMCESTVKVHVRNIMKRLKAQNRTQVAYLVGQLMRSSDNP
ncbi:response regulator transcription factor [Hyphomicrobium sp. CS1GBMeth3]|uniref:LuxR C-terminal-related transcriptional regulator n=1 Tax=Hyphomicrobium sp. CS1GBMeth3 TaxID=1892845 RepID=UPI0009306858|nr:response regulator transcription factor [Hyphomicrobium sp. CS1GBMeth3]